MHTLDKPPHPKSSSSSSSRHQYQKVPLDAESDSEDDETLLYAAPSLNEQASQTVNSFGVSVYDHSCDLDLPRIRQLPEKGRRLNATGRTRNCTNSKPFACIFVVLACLLVSAIAAFAVLLAGGNWDDTFSSDPSGSIPAPSCFPVPKPLPDGKRVPCLTTTHENTAPPVSTQPNTPPPSSSSSPSEAPSTSKDTTLSETEPEATLNVAIDTSNQPSQHLNPETTKEAETTERIEEEPTSVDRLTGITTNDATEESHDTPYDEQGVRFNVEVAVGGQQANPETSSCFPVPTPLSGSLVQPCHVPYPSSSFFPSSSSMNSARSASPSPTPVPVSSETEQKLVTTPITHDDVKTDPVRKETTRPTNFEQPTSAATGSEENNGKNGKLVPATDQNDDNAKPSEPSPSSKAEPLSWDRKFMPAVSESTPVVYDLDGDGIQERMVVEDFNQCAVHVSALSGIDGSTVWQQQVQFPAFAVRCILDVNSDGTMDCIVTGRGGGFLTLDGIDGHLLWVVDQALVFPVYNFYFPLLLPDINGDGVDDLVNIHGGDVSYEPENHNRSTAFLVAVSGKTGQMLMDPIPMPDGHESYMSPVLFAVNGVDKVILFGSGGETVPGSLWGLGLVSLQSRIESYWTGLHTSTEYHINLNDTFHPCTLEDHGSHLNRPVMDKTKFNFHRTQAAMQGSRNECPTWEGKQTTIWNDYNVCLYEFVRTVSKGVLLPPVAVDLNSDGVDDLVVSTFDGHTTALDGRNLKRTLWDAYFPGTESYSLPAPLFYTTDDIPDLLIRTNLGEWSDGYNVSSVRVLDGKDGSVLWTFNSTTSGMMSTVSVVSQTHGRDALIFFAVGQTSSDVLGTQGDNGRRKKRQEGEIELGEAENESEGVDYDYDMISNSITQTDPPDLWVSTPDDPLPDIITLDSLLEYCGESRAGMTISLYMVTREMIESGLGVRPLATYEPHLYFRPGGNPSNHSIHQQHVLEKRHGGTHSDDGLSSKEARKLARCGHLSSPIHTVGTPLLTDLNSDGRLDIVYDVIWSPAMAVPPQMLVVATDLEVLFKSAYGSQILDFESFLPPEEQPWTKYMGKEGDCLFRLHPQS